MCTSKHEFTEKCKFMVRPTLTGIVGTKISLLASSEYVFKI